MIWQQNIDESSIPEGLSAAEEAALQNLMRLTAHQAAAMEEYNETFGHYPALDTEIGHNERALPAIYTRFADFYTDMED